MKEKNKNNDQDYDPTDATSAGEQNNYVEGISGQKTEVKNANAAGIGALGRNDEKLTDDKSGDTGDADDY